MMQQRAPKCPKILLIDASGVQQLRRELRNTMGYCSTTPSWNLICSSEPPSKRRRETPGHAQWATERGLGMLWSSESGRITKTSVEGTIWSENHSELKVPSSGQQRSEPAVHNENAKFPQKASANMVGMAKLKQRISQIVPPEWSVDVPNHNAGLLQDMQSAIVDRKRHGWSNGCFDGNQLRSRGPCAK